VTKSSSSPMNPSKSALKRFKKQCEKAGLLSEFKKRQHYEKAQRSAQAEGPRRAQEGEAAGANGRLAAALRTVPPALPSSPDGSE